jgi:hypothetical protein
MAFGLITSCKLIQPHFYITFNELHYTEKEELQKFVIINGCKYVTTSYSATKKYNLKDEKDYCLCMCLTKTSHFNSYTVAKYNLYLHERNLQTIQQTHTINRNVIIYNYNSKGISRNIKLLQCEQLQLNVFS